MKILKKKVEKKEVKKEVKKEAPKEVSRKVIDEDHIEITFSDKSVQRILV